MADITRVTANDLIRIAEIERESFGAEAWSGKLFAEAFARTEKDTVFLCAKDKDVVAGYIVLQTIAGEGSIDTICVDVPYRRKGLAKKLLTKATETARNAYGACSFTLEVRRSNQAARALYESIGFVQEGVRPSYYQNPREDACIYRKQDGETANR